MWRLRSGWPLSLSHLSSGPVAGSSSLFTTHSPTRKQDGPLPASSPRRSYSRNDCSVNEDTFPQAHLGHCRRQWGLTDLLTQPKKTRCTAKTSGGAQGRVGQIAPPTLPLSAPLTYSWAIEIAECTPKAFEEQSGWARAGRS